MNPDVVPALVLLILGLAGFVAVAILVEHDKREARLAKIETELKALTATLPASFPGAVDSVVAAFALGAAFATSIRLQSGHIG